MLEGTDQTKASLSKGTNQPGPSLFLLPVSLLVMLNLPLMFTLATGPDQYSFWTITAWQGTGLPLFLSFLTNCFLALLAFGGHLILCQWQYRGSGGQSKPFKRAALVVGIPLLLAFMPSTLLTVNGGQAFPVAVGFLLFASMTVTVALRDPEAELSPQDAVTWLWGAIVTIVVLLVMAIAVMLLLYTAETLLPTGNLFWTAELDWTRMSFVPEEYVGRHLGVMVLFTILACAYMIFIVGGAMVGQIWARAWPESTAAAPATDNPPKSGPAPTVPVEEPSSQRTSDAEAKDGGTVPAPDPESGDDDQETKFDLQRLWQIIRQEDSGPTAPYVVFLNGEQVGVSQQTYTFTFLTNYETRLIGNMDLYINMVKEQVYLCGEPLQFYGESQTYYLVCIYAGKKPGLFYSNSALRREIIAYLGFTPSGLNESRTITYLINNKFQDHPIIARKRGETKVLDNRNVFLIKSRNNQ